MFSTTNLVLKFYIMNIEETQENKKNNKDVIVGGKAPQSLENKMQNRIKEIEQMKNEK